MQVSQVSLQDEEQAVRRIRDIVFVQEQSVPVALEHDDRDWECVHVLATDHEEPVGTARIDLQQGGKIGRVAVLTEFRGRGIGAAMMQTLHAIASDAELASVWLHAQKSTVEFYARMGYVSEGPEFVEADIVHQKMVLAIGTGDEN